LLRLTPTVGMCVGVQQKMLRVLVAVLWAITLLCYCSDCAEDMTAYGAEDITTHNVTSDS